MVAGILQNTPYWVWGVFVVLLVVGLLQTRTRNVSRALIFVLPAIMIPLSFYAVVAAFGLRPVPIIAWAFGIAAALVLNGLIFRAPARVRYAHTIGKFEIPGSWIPLILMMTIFLARFVLGVTTAVNPALVATDTFIVTVSSVLGLCSGLFAARAIKTLSAQRAAA